MLRILTAGLLALLLGVSLVYAQDEATPIPTPAPVATSTPIPRPAPVAVIEQESATLERYFASIPQGGTGLLHVRGAGLAGARARFLDDLIDFFPGPDAGYYGLLSVDMEQAARVYPLSVFAWTLDGQRVTINTEVEIVLGSFIRQDDLIIPPDRAFLVDSEIERTEIARLESIFSQVTPQRLWDETGFQYPILNTTLTSPFGAFRTFNGTFRTRHTGWDLRTTLGVPLMAMAGGEVAFAGRLEIRGNMVAIDHGYGIFSTYSHLSQIHVTRGQTVVKGQIIGVTGDTGRSSGPHFHWEIAVNGHFVDSVDFASSWLP